MTQSNKESGANMERGAWTSDLIRALAVHANGGEFRRCYTRLARSLGVSQSLLSNVVRGAVSPSADLCDRLDRVAKQHGVGCAVLTPLGDGDLGVGKRLGRPRRSAPPSDTPGALLEAGTDRWWSGPRVRALAFIVNGGVESGSLLRLAPLAGLTTYSVYGKATSERPTGGAASEALTALAEREGVTRERIDQAVAQFGFDDATRSRRIKAFLYGRGDGVIMDDWTPRRVLALSVAMSQESGRKTFRVLAAHLRIGAEYVSRVVAGKIQINRRLAARLNRVAASVGMTPSALDEIAENIEKTENRLIGA